MIHPAKSQGYDKAGAADQGHAFYLPEYIGRDCGNDPQRIGFKTERKHLYYADRPYQHVPVTGEKGRYPRKSVHN